MFYARCFKRSEYVGGVQDLGRPTCKHAPTNKNFSSAHGCFTIFCPQRGLPTPIALAAMVCPVWRVKTYVARSRVDFAPMMSVGKTRTPASPVPTAALLKSTSMGHSATTQEQHHALSQVNFNVYNHRSVYLDQQGYVCPLVVNLCVFVCDSPAHCQNDGWWDVHRERSRTLPITRRRAHLCNCLSTRFVESLVVAGLSFPF